MELETETEITAIIVTLNREEAEWLKRTAQNALPDESSQDYTRRDRIWGFLNDVGIK